MLVNTVFMLMQVSLLNFYCCGVLKLKTPRLYYKHHFIYNSNDILNGTLYFSNMIFQILPSAFLYLPSLAGRGTLITLPPEVFLK